MDMIERLLEVVEGLRTLPADIVKALSSNKKDFYTRPGYFVTTVNLPVGGVQALPAADAYMIISAATPGALGLSIGEQTASNPWPFGVVVRTGSPYDKPAQAFISSSVAQQVVVAYVQGGADLWDSRQFALALDTSNRQVMSGFQAGAPIASGGSSATIAALGTSAVGVTGALVAGVTYLLRVRARVACTNAGAFTLLLRHNGAGVNVNQLATLAVGGTVDFDWGGGILFTATANAAVDVFFTSLVAFAGTADVSINISRATS